MKTNDHDPRWNHKLVKSLTCQELDGLAADIRKFLIEKISNTGGHIGANLGVVELTIALHSEFSSPDEPIIFDTGHIGYTHKILTGRANLFQSLNTYGGMSRFITPTESQHDLIEASHAGTAISVAFGISKARKLANNEKWTIAFVGDSAMAEGSSFEAINHASVEETKLLIVLNDNGYAISPGFGALHNALQAQGSSARWFFESLGIRYFGPIDGHNIKELKNTIKEAKKTSKVPLIHVKTEKGKGLAAASAHPFKMHFSLPFDLKNGEVKTSSAPAKTFPDVAGNVLLEAMHNDKKIVCLTPSTIYATGLAEVFSRFPERCIDPGMAEQHTLSMTVGLALEGYRPVIAYQSTFLQRAFDQLIHDVCFSNLPILILSMRSGFSGYDNPTHHGIYDISFMRALPNLKILYPRNKVELEAMMKSSLDNIKSPTVIMMPYGDLVDDEEYFSGQVDAPEQCRVGSNAVILTVGNKFKECAEVADELDLGLVNIRRLKPLPCFELLEIFKRYSAVITVEEAVLDGGVGSSIAAMLSDNGLQKKILRIGLPAKFIEAGSNKKLCEVYGLDSAGIQASIIEFMNRQ